MKSLAARASTEWQDFTRQHARVRRRAREVALNRDGNHVAAVVGLYGSGKSTLLFDLMRACAEGGVLAVWDESAAFFERILGDSEAIRADEFVRRTLDWARRLREGGALEVLKTNLAERGRSDVVALLPDSPPGPGTRLVLLLDEMEQAHEMLRARIQTDDGNPLRSLFDASGEDLAIIVAYAPESYHSLGDADQGRHVTLRVPPLKAGVVAKTFGIPRGLANFAWWASRGRARGVVQAVDRIVKPVLEGELEDDPQLLATILEDLPRVFGVPAVIQDHLATDELLSLPRLEPQPCEDYFGIRLNADAPAGWIAEVESKIVQQVGDDLRRPILAVLHEIASIVGACAAADGYAVLAMNEVAPLLDLAVARAQEAGTIQGLGQQHREAVRYAIMALEPAPASERLRLTLGRLANEVFPSPFTDPLLPVGGRHPSAAEVAQEFGRLAKRVGFSMTWPEHSAMAFVSFEDLEGWLTTVPPEELGRGFCRALLLDSGTPGPLTRLAVEAGLVRHEQVPSFSATFLQSAAVVLSREAGAEGASSLDLSGLARAVGESRDLKRKVVWHQERLANLLRTMRSQTSLGLESARQEADQLRSFLATKRLGKDSPGLLALSQLLETPTAQSTAALIELSEVFGTDRGLRKLSARSKRLGGAAVVVDDLLPSKGSSSRWAQANLPKLKAFVHQHSTASCSQLLSWLLAPETPTAMRVVLERTLPEETAPELLAGVQSLSRLSAVTARLGSVHAGLGAFLEESPTRLAETMDLGRVLNTAVRATSDTTQLEDLIRRLDDLPEPWVASLARWIVSQFVEVVLSAVNAEESPLREWERAAARASEVGAKGDRLTASLRELEWAGLAGRVDSARGHVRVKLDNPHDLLSAIDGLAAQIDGLNLLVAELSRLVEVAEGRQLDCRQLVKRFDPKGTDPQEDVLLVRQVLELLGDSEGRLPKPRGELRAWLVTLRDHLAKSREERLRSRVRAVLGAKIADRLSRLYENNVDDIEDEWARLDNGFQEGVRSRLLAQQPSASDVVSEVVHGSLSRYLLLDGMASPAPVPELDLHLRSAAEAGDLDQEGIGRELRKRDEVRDSLESLCRELASREILEAVVGSATSYSAAADALERFEGKVEDLWEQINSLEPTRTTSDVSETEDPDRFIAELRGIALALSSSHRELTDQLGPLNALCASLGAESVGLGSTSSVEDMREAVEVARATANQLVRDGYEKLQVRAKSIKVRLPPLRKSLDPLEASEAMETTRESLVSLEAGVAELAGLGISWSREQAKLLPLKKAGPALESRLKGGRRQIAASRKRLEALLLRMRLFRIPTGSLDDRVRSGRLDTLGEAQQEAESSLARAVGLKEAELSVEAMTVWRELRQTQPSGHAQVVELLRTGLLVAATPEALK